MLQLAKRSTAPSAAQVPAMLQPHLARMRRTRWQCPRRSAWRHWCGTGNLESQGRTMRPTDGDAARPKTGSPARHGRRRPLGCQPAAVTEGDLLWLVINGRIPGEASMPKIRVDRLVRLAHPCAADNPGHAPGHPQGGGRLAGNLPHGGASILFTLPSLRHPAAKRYRSDGVSPAHEA